MIDPDVYLYSDGGDGAEGHPAVISSAGPRTERTDNKQDFAASILALNTKRTLEMLGEDPDREGLLKTPERVARAWQFLTRGYEKDPVAILESAVFEEPYDEMVLVKDIEVYSTCEHHMLPFFGRAHVAYVPDGKIVGLSMLPRVVDVFARRLQVQERLTEQICDIIQTVLRPKGVAVLIEATHLCMVMRGVEKQQSQTVTNAMSGVFREDRSVRDAFVRLVERGR